MMSFSRGRPSSHSLHQDQTRNKTPAPVAQWRLFPFFGKGFPLKSQPKKDADSCFPMEMHLGIWAAFLLVSREPPPSLGHLSRNQPQDDSPTNNGLLCLKVVQDFVHPQYVGIQPNQSDSRPARQQDSQPAQQPSNNPAKREAKRPACKPKTDHQPNNYHQAASQPDNHPKNQSASQPASLV